MTTVAKPSLEVRITKSLLGYGVIAGPIYVTVVAVQALTRAGFDPTRHAASQLATGDLGWIQVTNFLVTGAMTLAASVGIRRALGSRRVAAGASALIGGYGAALIAAGLFRADPSHGFPPGTSPTGGEVSWHGVAHLISASVGFVSLIAACFVVGTWFSRQQERGWAWYSRSTAIVFAIGFAAIASGSGGVIAMLAFTIAIVLGWAWLSAISVKLYRAMGPGCTMS
jgi:hypothetical protein